MVIPEDAGADMIAAGLTAVAALAYRYDDAPVNLSLTVPRPRPPRQPNAWWPWSRARPAR